VYQPDFPTFHPEGLGGRCPDSSGAGAGRGRGRRDPFPPRQRRTLRARKEPSRRGAAHACRVVVSTPTASGFGA